MRDTEITAFMICPSRELAQQFQGTLASTRLFQVLAEMKSYPPAQTLEIRLRQLKPDVILLDLASDLDAACQVIEFVAPVRPEVHVIGLHLQPDSEAIIRSLRVGASEFLAAPFDARSQQEAVARIRKLRQPEAAGEPEMGKIVAFASAKPGSGASTLATQTAFAVRKLSGKRVLLMDLDLMGGTIGFYLKLNHAHSLLDALDHAGGLTPAAWSGLTVNSGGVDILPAPESPYSDPIDTARLQEVLHYARLMYDWTILDLPSIFHKISLLAAPEVDHTYLVSTSELPSLHLARKAVSLMNQLGFTKEQFQVVINRVNRRDGISSSDMEKIFNCPVHASFPNDYFSLHRVVTLGQPLGNDCELGRAIEGLAGKLAGVAPEDKRRRGGLLEARTAFLQA
ncbi:MAG: P-loop NTPase [Methylotetracoccus sp.]|jgi:pilus assembly protein CpaE|nr:P-loop NTPase [Methylotetracoccus sp.]